MARLEAGAIAIEATHAQQGWWIAVHRGDELLGRTRITPMQLSLLMRGRVVREGELELRGLRHEMEIRNAGAVVGRIPKPVVIEFLATLPREG